MNKNLKLLIYLCAFVLLVFAAILVYDYLAPKYEPVEVPDEESELQKMPEITFYDSDNDPHTISGFSGKPAVINIWATWCGYCVREMPYFEVEYMAYGDRVSFIMLNATDGQHETKQKVQEFIAHNKYTFPVYYDFDDNISSLGIQGYPTTIFIDADGYITKVVTGAMSKNSLYVAVQELLNG